MKPKVNKLWVEALRSLSAKAGPMKPKVKKFWIEALRSGKYRQIQHRLFSDAGYCCLGVLCKISRKRIDEQFALPVSVLRWAGLHDNDPMLGDCSASRWNDSGATFAEIADLIERHL